MTFRRASGTGRRLRLIAAVRRANVWSAFCAAAALGLLLTVGAGHASTRSPHSRHGAVESAGKASAHVVHESGLPAARGGGRFAGSRRASHNDRSTHSELPIHSARTRGSEAANRQGRSSAKTRKGSSESRNSRRGDDVRDTGKPLTKAHGRRNRHGGREQPVDDPQPMHRASADRQRPDSRLLARRRTPVEAAPDASAEFNAAARFVPEPALPTHEGTPGNVARNRARHSGSAPASVASRPTSITGSATPDNSERSPLPDTSSQPRPSAPIPRVPPGPIATVTAAAPTPLTPLTSEVVQGFGAEVGFHTTASGNGKAAPAVPRESAAQQQRELREAAEIASKPMFVPLYSREGKLVVPPPLKGSRDILVHQNQMADDAGLARIQDDNDLARLRRTHLLVDFPESASLRINEGLPENRRSARPWTVKFATDIAHAFYQRFGEALQVNSAVRTVAYQIRLQRVNGNAAATLGEGASPHLTGQAIDFGKRGMSVAEIAWMRSYLMPLIDAGKIDVEEEFRQACFHISVYSIYASPSSHREPARTEVAQITAPAHAHGVAALTAAEDNEMP